MKQGDEKNGFVITRVVNIPEIRVCVYEAHHAQTGANFIHLHCEDSENLFAIAFKTPPWDSTGLPHIIEHSVLAGSHRYPLKDVFNELIKGSLQTFLNAFTYPDKTVYPVASQVKKDFYNLATVYTDLVFNPRLLLPTFWQEAHHLKLNPAAAEGKGESGEWSISGVVYNEMRGAYSSINSLALKILQENLYPRTPYAFDAGGDPRVIPHLTYERFCAYHRAHYNLHNSLFFFYGNIPPAEHLEFLGSIVGNYRSPAPADKIIIPKQRHWRKPRLVRARYPLQKGEKETAMVNVAWLLHDATDIKKGTLLSLLSELLIGSPAAPLRKALLEARLGEDLSPTSGCEREMRQTAFCVGLRGVERDNIDKVEGFILEELAHIVATGFDEELKKGVFHQAEFVGREITRKAYPYGIVLMGTVLQSWLYGGDTVAGLNFPQLLASVRSELVKKPHLFEGLIEEWLLANPHRLTAVLLPDVKLLARKEATLRREVKALVKSLSPSQIEETKKINEAVVSYQHEPNDGEALCSLPLVTLADIPRTIDRITVSDEFELVGKEGDKKGGENAAPLVRVHDIFTNGICYLDIAFPLPLSSLAGEKAALAALPFFARSIVKLGAASLSYDQMAKKIARHTGGITAGVACGRCIGGGDWQRLLIGIKMLPDNIEAAIDILSELILSGRLDENERIEELLWEARNGIAAALIPSGHLFAKMSATAGISELGHWEEIWEGKSQLDYLNGLADDFPAQRATFLETLARFHKLILRRSGVIINISAPDAVLPRLEKALQGLFALLPVGEGASAFSPLGYDSKNIAVAVPAAVCFVAKALSAPTYEHRLAPYLLVLSHLISNDYLYREVRAIGGAYGGFASYDITAGVFSLISYRDPHLTRTMDVFEKTAAALPALLADTDGVQKAIIAAAGKLDKPLDPAGKGRASLFRYLAGLADERRQRFREAILEAQANDLQEAGEFLFANAQGSYGVYASDRRLQKELAAKLGFTFR